MSDRLSISTDELRATGTLVRQVAADLDDANARSSRAADHVGHAGLAACLEEFATGWETKRASLVEDIARLADACSAVGETFEEIDSALAAGLRGEG